MDELNDALVPGDVDVVVAPTFVHLPMVLSSLKKEYQVAAQNCWVSKPGAYTGEVRCAFLFCGEFRCCMQACSSERCSKLKLAYMRRVHSYVREGSVRLYHLSAWL